MVRLYRRVRRRLADLRRLRRLLRRLERRARRRPRRRLLRRDRLRPRRRDRRRLLRRERLRPRRRDRRRLRRADFLRPRRRDRRRLRRRDLRAERRLRRRGICFSLMDLRARRRAFLTRLAFRDFRDFFRPRFFAQYAARPAGMRPLRRFLAPPTRRRALPIFARPLIRIFLRRPRRAGLTYKIGMLLPCPR